MKVKLLLFICCLFAIEGWANSNVIRLIRSDIEPNPLGVPISPITETCTIITNILDISFNKVEDYATVIITNKTTGEIVHLDSYQNTNLVTIDMSSCDKGEYSIHITLNNSFLQGVFIVR